MYHESQQSVFQRIFWRCRHCTHIIIISPWKKLQQLCMTQIRAIALCCSPSNRQRSMSAIEYLEKFRHGPETQSEWNLLLWRITFPMITLVVFTILAVIGKFGHMIYSFLVCPVWYFTQFVLVTHPFLLIFKFERMDITQQIQLWQALAVLSIAISVIEWVLASPPMGSSTSLLTRPGTNGHIAPAPILSASMKVRFQHHSWIVANTLFGVIALIAIPHVFSRDKRVPARDPYDVMMQSSTGTHLMPLSPSTPIEESPVASLTPPSSLHNTQVTTIVSSPSISSSIRQPSRHTPPLARKSIVARSNSSLAQSRSRLVWFSYLCMFIVWFAMISSYTTTIDLQPNSRYWFIMYVASPVICILCLFLLRQSPTTTYSFDHVVVFTVLVIHLPVFLGHLCFRLFTLVEEADPAHPIHQEKEVGRGIAERYTNSSGSGTISSLSASTSWLQLGISILFLLSMQTYFFVMTRIVTAMSEPFAHPSLLYLGQLYYYLFWYILVGTDTPMDSLYWGMLLVNNIHIAFLNTGLYADVKQSSSICCSMSKTSIGMRAMCFRPTTMTMFHATSHSPIPLSTTSVRNARDVDVSVNYGPSSKNGVMLQRRSGNTQAALAGVESIEDGSFSRVDVAADDEGNSKTKTRKSGTVARHSFSRLSTLLMPLSAARSLLPSSNNISSSAATIYFTPTECVRKCSNIEDDSTPPRTSPTNSRTSTHSLTPTSDRSSVHLRSLYFLMKVAEQDNMADTTALILVPSLLTLLGVLEKPSHGFSILMDQMNMWIRCICMFIGRLGGAYLAREIFTYKLRARLRRNGRNLHEEELLGETIEGISTRLWIQRLMLQDFHHQFWYLTVVTIVVTFACFERMELPSRFAMLT